VTLKAVATAIDVPLKSGIVSAEGDLDFRCTLGVAKGAPVGFEQIRVRFQIDTDAPQKSSTNFSSSPNATALSITIKNGPPVKIEFAR
jgi:hypothetical protein